MERWRNGEIENERVRDIETKIQRGFVMEKWRDIEKRDLETERSSDGEIK